MTFDRATLLDRAEHIERRPQFIVDPTEIPRMEDRELVMGLGQTALYIPELSFRIIDPAHFQTVEDFGAGWEEKEHLPRTIVLGVEESIRTGEDLMTVGVGFLQLTRMVFNTELDKPIKYDDGTEGAIGRAVEYIESKTAGSNEGRVAPGELRVLRFQMWLRHNWRWSVQQARRHIKGADAVGEVILLRN